MHSAAKNAKASRGVLLVGHFRSLIRSWWGRKMIRLRHLTPRMQRMVDRIRSLEEERDYLRARLGETLRLYRDSCELATEYWLDNRRLQEELGRLSVELDVRRAQL